MVSKNKNQMNQSRKGQQKQLGRNQQLGGQKSGQIQGIRGSKKKSK